MVENVQVYLVPLTLVMLNNDTNPTCNFLANQMAS